MFANRDSRLPDYEMYKALTTKAVLLVKHYDFCNLPCFSFPLGELQHGGVAHARVCSVLFVYPSAPDLTVELVISVRGDAIRC